MVLKHMSSLNNSKLEFGSMSPREIETEMNISSSRVFYLVKELSTDK